MAVAAVDYFVGSMQQNVQLPAWLQGRSDSAIGAFTLGIGKYRLFIIVVCVALTLALQAVLSRTRFGSRLRASVDDPRVAGGARPRRQPHLPADLRRRLRPGRPRRRARRRSARARPDLPAQVHDLFPDRRLGRRHDVRSPARSLAALLLGIADVAGKYYVPKLGAFIVYTLMIAILLLAPAGAVRARAAHDERAQAALALGARRALALVGARACSRRCRCRGCCRRHALLLNEIAILALFALSLDLSSATPASSRSATPRSSASAATARRCSPST